MAQLSDCALRVIDNGQQGLAQSRSSHGITGIGRTSATQETLMLRSLAFAAVEREAWAEELQLAVPNRRRYDDVKPWRRARAVAAAREPTANF